MDKLKLLRKSKHFCMLPWVHLHALPSSAVTPCCVWPYDKPVGNLKDDSIENVWNNDAYKEIRLKMLKDEYVKGCEQCYERERAGESMRTRANHDWAHHFEDIVIPTENDGALRSKKMPYFDIRFSNICNFKCRGCSPELSSSWLSDHEKLHNYKSGKDKLISILPNENAWNELRAYVPTIEHAYFAGGEPLIMDEHYLILEELIAAGKTDVRLSYNTNLSNLRFRDKYAQDYWKKFSNVSIGISIDDFGRRGEYFRNGMNWQKTVENIRIVQQNCPHVIFSINCTVSLFNVFYLPELHHEALKLGLITPGNFYANILVDPVEYRVQLLPKEFRQKCLKKYFDYVFRLKEVLNPAAIHENARIMSEFQSVMNLLASEDTRSTLEDFIKLTKKLDAIRGENFFEVYPELAFLNEYSTGTQS